MIVAVVAVRMIVLVAVVRGCGRADERVRCAWSAPTAWYCNEPGPPAGTRRGAQPAAANKPRCVHSAQTPIRMTSRPVMIFIQISTRCGMSPGSPSEASTPTSTIPLVCESVTKMPRIHASTGRPRAPTM